MLVQEFFEIVERLCYQSNSLALVIGNHKNEKFKVVMSVGFFDRIIFSTGDVPCEVSKEYVIKKLDNITETVSSVIVTCFHDHEKHVYGFGLDRNGNGIDLKIISPEQLFTMYNTAEDGTIELPKMNVVYHDINGGRYHPFESIWSQQT